MKAFRETSNKAEPYKTLFGGTQAAPLCVALSNSCGLYKAASHSVNLSICCDCSELTGRKFNTQSSSPKKAHISPVKWSPPCLSPVSLWPVFLVGAPTWRPAAPPAHAPVGCHRWSHSSSCSSSTPPRADPLPRNPPGRSCFQSIAVGELRVRLSQIVFV